MASTKGDPHKARESATKEIRRLDKKKPSPRNRIQRKQKEERLRRIIGLMTTPGGWRVGVSPKLLAEEYGLSLHTIEIDAAEAARYIRGDLPDRDEMRASIISQYQAITAQAFKASKFRDATSSLDSVAEILGIKRRYVEVELELDLDRKLNRLAEVLTPESYHLVTSVLAGKSRESPSGASDSDGDIEGEADGSEPGPEGTSS